MNLQSVERLEVRVRRARALDGSEDVFNAGRLIVGLLVVALLLAGA